MRKLERRESQDEREKATDEKQGAHKVTSEHPVVVRQADSSPVHANKAVQNGGANRDIVLQTSKQANITPVSPQIRNPKERTKREKERLQRDLQEREENLMRRIQKLNSAKENNKKALLVKFILLSLIFVILFTFGLLWNYIGIVSFTRIMAISYDIFSFFGNLKMLFVVFNESLYRQMPILDGSLNLDLFAQLYQTTYSLGIQVAEATLNYPVFFGSFLSYMNGLLLQSICNQPYMTSVASKSYH